MKITLNKNEISSAIEKYLQACPGVGEVYSIEIEQSNIDMVGENSIKANCNVEFSVVKK